MCGASCGILSCSRSPIIRTMAPEVRSLMNRALGERERVTEGAWHEGEEGVVIK